MSLHLLSRKARAWEIQRANPEFIDLNKNFRWKSFRLHFCFCGDKLTLFCNIPEKIMGMTCQ